MKSAPKLVRGFATLDQVAHNHNIPNYGYESTPVW